MSEVENVKMTEMPVDNTTAQATQTPTAPQEQQVKLVDVPVTNENTALNVMVQFLNLAQRRGVFAIDESAKIYECFKVFTRNDAAATTSAATANSM
jgi:hypothetical protein|tara:strand:- start:483 stop:770 length:288 start_codon:yes stop_codon:yes gene_type:complete